MAEGAPDVAGVLVEDDGAGEVLYGLRELFLLAQDAGFLSKGFHVVRGMAQGCFVGGQGVVHVAEGFCCSACKGKEDEASDHQNHQGRALSLSLSLFNFQTDQPAPNMLPSLCRVWPRSER